MNFKDLKVGQVGIWIGGRGLPSEAETLPRWIVSACIIRKSADLHIKGNFVYVKWLSPGIRIPSGGWDFNRFHWTDRILQV